LREPDRVAVRIDNPRLSTRALDDSDRVRNDASGLKAGAVSLKIINDENDLAATPRVSQCGVTLSDV
jgi:hypothetical protein